VFIAILESAYRFSLGSIAGGEFWILMPNTKKFQIILNFYYL
jgi:hypothetical protein